MLNSLRGLPPPYLAELCRPVVHLTGRRHVLRSAASGKLDVQRKVTAVGRKNVAVSGPEIWNSLPVELRLSTLSTVTLKHDAWKRISLSALNDVPAARLILFKAALFINVIISGLITFLMFFSRNVPMLRLFLLHIFLTLPLRIIPYPTVGKLPMSNRSLKKDALTTLVIIDLYL